MRCFIAIDLPKEAKKELSEIQKRLPEAQMKSVNPEIIHLTVKFLGELNDKEVNNVKEALKRVQFSKFKAKLNSIGVFTPSFIKVVWVKLAPEEKFLEIHDTIDKLLSLENFKKDERWESHATLARVKFVKDKKKFLDELKKISVKEIEFTVDNIRLKKSVLTEKGPVYEDILEVKLN